MQSILIVDDDPGLLEILQKILLANNFSVEIAGNWEEMTTCMLNRLFDLYLLDINLPSITGYEICKILRDQDDQTPIIMLTARGEDNDRIHGLEAGADDYLAKPFNAQELLARIKAVLRRHAYVPNNVAGQVESFSVGAFKYESKINALVKDEERIILTAHELAVLKVLYFQRGKPISRSLIAQHLYGFNFQPDQRAIDILISRLRKTLGDCGPNFTLIQTIRGKGYLLVDENAF